MVLRKGCNELDVSLRDRAGEAGTVDALRAKIVRGATRFGLQRADAEDVAQTVILRVLSGQLLGDHESQQGWVWKAARNAAVDFLRVAKRRRAREAAWSDVPSSAARDPEWKVAVNRARACVDALPEALRDTLMLCFDHDLSHQAAADALGVPLGTLKTRVRLGLALARRSVASDEGTSETQSEPASKSNRGCGVVIRKQVRVPERSRR